MHRLFAVLLVGAAAGCAGPVPVPSFPVFFTESSGQLDDPARQAIAQAAAAAKTHPTETVFVSGYADPSGPAQTNIDISGLRATAVSEQLVGDGVDPSRIKLRAHGATGTATAQESRRVDITIGAP